MVAAAILDFYFFFILTVGAVKSTELHHYAKFIEIARTAVKISQFLDYSKWRLPLSWILKILNF